MQFPYTPRSTDYGITQEPRVPVMFTDPVTGNFVLLFCLVDSGASDIILNAQFASLLGTDLTAAPSQEYQGIGDESFRAYKHQITIRMQAAKEAFTVLWAFMPDLRIDCILGQNGFFDTHKIVFEKYKKRFAITPVMKKRNNLITSYSAMDLWVLLYLS